MKKYSIIFTINVVFLISFALLSVGFVMLNSFNKEKERHVKHKREIEISKIFMHQYRTNGIDKEFTDYIKSLNFNIVSDTTRIEDILNTKDIEIKDIKSKRLFKIKYLVAKDKSYIYIQTPNREFILSDSSALSSDKSIILGIYLFIILIFVFLYTSIISKLKPLKKLKESVKKFGYENFDLECSTSDSDEISQLANEFHKSAIKLKKIKESRNVFIRNVMHELKTPITKGKLLAQLPQTDKNIQSMQKVFYRLEYLISEFASIEELISTKKKLDKREYFLEDIVDNSVDILMCSDDEVVKEFDNIKISVDFNLFCIAVKNLIDNGIKYSSNKKVTIKTNGDMVVFENIANKLTYELDSYFEPFFREGDLNKDQSFGLGLYIVKHILDAHNLTLEYKHVNGVNIFIIKLTN